jgi:molecular chaperone DnaK (HSP70)
MLAEQAKRALSHQDELEVALPGLARDAQGAAADFTTRLSRARLEELTADLVERTLAVVQEVLQAAALSPQGLDEVLLLGGQSRSPHVRRRLEEALGRPVRTAEDGPGLVARGAALLGHSLVRAAQGKAPIQLSEVLSTPVGLAERGGTVRRVLERNTRLPATKTLVLPAHPGEPLALLLVQGEASMAEDNELLGTLTLTPERPGEVEVHFTMSADGLLTLEVELPGVRRHAATLDTRQPETEELTRLLTLAPEGDAPPPPAGGLLGGLRRLFGRR